MKQIVCEMCGGKDLVKQNGVFVCQNCQAKYSVEEAKKIMVEIDTPAKLENNSTNFSNEPLVSSNGYQPKSQVIAFILCFFAGGLGAHRFYVGKTGTGILMLLLIIPSVTFLSYATSISELNYIYGGKSSQEYDTLVIISIILVIIFGIWILIDLIRIITGSFFDDYNSEYVDSNPKRVDSVTVELDEELIRTKNKEHNIILYIILILFLIILIYLRFT